MVQINLYFTCQKIHGVYICTERVNVGPEHDSQKKNSRYATIQGRLGPMSYPPPQKKKKKNQQSNKNTNKKNIN